MESPAAAPAAYMNASQKIEAALDGVVDHGSDDELFTASYLQGHFAVIARQQEMNQNASLVTLNDEMQKSFDAAFANNELDEDDQQRVLALWSRLLKQT